MHKIIAKNIEVGLMIPTSSPWASTCLLVRKKSGAFRLVCDYRLINEATISDCYPLPRIDDLITNLSHSRVFSSTDLWTGFHQVLCTKEAMDKLAITTEFGQFG